MEDTVDGKEQGFLALVTTPSERYQDRWSWFFPGPRPFLNPPGRREKAQSLIRRTRTCVQRTKNKTFIIIVSPFEGPFGGNFKCSPTRTWGRGVLFPSSFTFERTEGANPSPLEGRRGRTLSGLRGRPVPPMSCWGTIDLSLVTTRGPTGPLCDSTIGSKEFLS